MAEYNQHPSRTMAPRIVINEKDQSNYSIVNDIPKPISVVFGFAPNGVILENQIFVDSRKFIDEFSMDNPNKISTAEKYFMNACLNVINQGGSVIPIRLPYDNEQANTVKYFRYQLSDVYGLDNLNDSDYISDHQVLKEINKLDPSVTHYRKIIPRSIDQLTGEFIVEHMAIDDFNEFILDPYETGILESIYFFDKRGEQLRKSKTKDAFGNIIEYLGICPVIVSASTALYYQEKIKNDLIMDEIFNPLTIPIHSTNTYTDYIEKNSIAIDKGVSWRSSATGTVVENELADQATLKNIFDSFSQDLNFIHHGNYYDQRTVSDNCAELFPLIRYTDKDHFEKTYLGAIGVIVLKMVYNTGTEKVDFQIEESFVGNVFPGKGNGLRSIEAEINDSSKYLHCALTTYTESVTDFYHIQNQPLVIMGMREDQCQKYIHYKKSIIEPIQYILDTSLSDLDSLQIDLILDAGLTTIAHYAYHYWKQRSDLKLAVDIVNVDKSEIGFSLGLDENVKTSQLTTYNIGTLDDVLRKIAKGIKTNPNQDLIPGSLTDISIDGYYFDYNGNRVELGDLLNTAANSIYKDTVTICSNCNGLGTILGQKCKVCDGTGLINETDDEDDLTGIPRQSFGDFYFDPNKDVANSYTLNEGIVEECSTAWLTIVKMFTNFIEYRRGDCLYLVDGPRCLNLIKNYPLATFVKSSNDDLFNSYLKYFSGITSSYAARYYNWVYGSDILTTRGLWFPPTVFIGGIFTQSERDKFPWYAVAGVERGVLNNVYNVSIKTKSYGGENDILYKNNWNFMRQHINVGVVIEGQKTFQSKPTALDRINVRRLCNYLKQNIRVISNRYKYEQNTEEIREQYRNDLEALFKDVQMNSGISDFFIQCDDKLNTLETIDRNELHAKIWFKPVKAIEFIFIDLTITKQDINFQENSLNQPSYY